MWLLWLRGQSKEPHRQGFLATRFLSAVHYNNDDLCTTNGIWLTADDNRKLTVSWTRRATMTTKHHFRTSQESVTSSIGTPMLLFYLTTNSARGLISQMSVSGNSLASELTSVPASLVHHWRTLPVWQSAVVPEYSACCCCSSSNYYFCNSFEKGISTVVCEE